VKSLVVDDDFVPRMVLQRILQAHGLCDAATNAADALAAVRHAIEEKTPYSLICLDIEMPDDSGHHVLQEIRRLEAESLVPSELIAKVLMTSSHSEAEQVTAAYDNGCDGFLVKPIELQRLMKALRELLLIVG